jgi:hypothetical protein
LIPMKSTLVGCTYLLLEAPRGSFYRHKGPRSRWKQSRKANLAFCRVAHRTVRCTPDTVRCPISFLLRRSQPLAVLEPLAHRTCPVHTGQSGAHRTLSGARFLSFYGEADRWHSWSRWRTGQSGAHRTVRCPLPTVGSATCPAQIARPTVGPADRWLTGQSGAHRTVR